jgi:hypothetical protein
MHRSNQASFFRKNLFCEAYGLEDVRELKIISLGWKLDSVLPGEVDEPKTVDFPTISMIFYLFSIVKVCQLLNIGALTVLTPDI